MRSYLEKTHHNKKGLVEWLKVYALSSSPSTEKNRKRRKDTGDHAFITATFGET
jgi:hypothetical protein